MRVTDEDIRLALGRVATQVIRLGGDPTGWAADPAPSYGGWSLLLAGGRFAGGVFLDANRMPKQRFWQALRMCADILADTVKAREQRHSESLAALIVSETSENHGEG